MSKIRLTTPDFRNIEMRTRTTWITKTGRANVVTNGIPKSMSIIRTRARKKSCFGGIFKYLLGFRCLFLFKLQQGQEQHNFSLLELMDLVSPCCDCICNRDKLYSLSLWQLRLGTALQKPLTATETNCDGSCPCCGCS